MVRLPIHMANRNPRASRIPDYWLGDEGAIFEAGGQLGLERLPIAWAAERNGRPRT
jgi:hypothetical protein